MANVKISQDNWDKIIDYAYTAYKLWKTEIGGMAIVHKVDDEYIIEDPIILKQEVTAGNTILDKDALAEYYVKTAMEHKDKQDFQFLWWHSHHTMAAFWSGTDLKAIDEFSDGKISMSLVVNLKEEYKFRINVWDPIEAHEDIEITIGDEEDASERDVNVEVVNETKALCEKPEYPTHKWYKPGKGAIVNGSQRSLFEQRKEMVQFNQSFLPEMHEVDDDTDPILLHTHSYLIKSVDDLLEKVCDGTYNYNQFKYRMNKLKDKLTENGLDSYEITIPTEKELQGMIMHITAVDLVTDYDGYSDDYADMMNQWR